jgi:hypothetical protein
MNKTIKRNLANEVNELYQQDATAKAVFDVFSARQKDARFSAVDRVAYLIGSSRSEVIRIFKALEEAGCGRFINGRKGYKSRMEWDFSIRSLAEAAKGQVSSVAEINFSEVEEDQSDDEDDDLCMVRHPFKLRSDLSVELILPADLTIKEAERIAAFVKTLPFD